VLIQTLDELFAFLYRWHQAEPGELGLGEAEFPSFALFLLKEFYLRAGLLTRYESRFSPACRLSLGEEFGSSLGCQDYLCAPEQLKVSGSWLTLA
jgi:hypothetical protein